MKDHEQKADGITRCLICGFVTEEIKEIEYQGCIIERRFAYGCGCSDQTIRLWSIERKLDQLLKLHSTKQKP